MENISSIMENIFSIFKYLQQRTLSQKHLSLLKWKTQAWLVQLQCHQQQCSCLLSSSKLVRLNPHPFLGLLPFPSSYFPLISLAPNLLVPHPARGEAAKKPNRESWKQRTDMYMRPFLLNVFFSKRFIHAEVMQRGTSKVISVATTNSKDLRNTLPSLTHNDACRVTGN